MGCTSSKDLEKQAKRDGWEVPLARSQSMPFSSTLKSQALVEYERKLEENFHVVALTSSTYGILKVDSPGQDMEELPGCKDGMELDAVSEIYEKMKNLDIPAILEPKPWTEMSFNFPQRDAKLQPRSPVAGSELETINTWELMEGIEDDPLSPFPRSFTASAFGARRLEKAQSMFTVRTVEELDAALSKVVPQESDSCAATDARSSFSGAHGSGKDTSKHTSLSELMALRSGSSSPQLTSISVPPVAGANRDGVSASQVASSGNWKVTATLNKPVKVNSKEVGTGASMGDGGAAKFELKPSDVAPVAADSTSNPSRVDHRNVGSHAGIPQLNLDSDFEHVSARKSREIGADKEATSNSVSSKVGGKVSPLSLDSSYEHISLPKGSPAIGARMQTSIKVSPKLAERLAAFTVASPSPEKKSSPLSAKAAGKSSSLKLDVAAGNDKVLPGASSADPAKCPGTYVNNYPSSPDETQDPSSPLFDPDLLASFEKAFEQISEDDWYAVRRGDGETSTSGSTTDIESPVRRGSRGPSIFMEKPSLGEMNAKGNKISQVVPEAAQVKNVKKIPSAKVSPMASAEKKVEVKLDPMAKFERKCPPGGEGRVVLYSTSLRGIRKTFEDCNNLRMILESFSVGIDERDVSLHSEFRQELKDLMGKPVPVPRVFIKGRYVGGHEEVAQLHEDGLLTCLLEDLPTEKSRIPCDGCGGVRFVPCMDCSGSCKVVSEDGDVTKCTNCNENGLMRCPICF